MRKGCLMMRYIFKFTLCFLLFCISTISLAWDRSFSAGYGYAHDTNHPNFDNYGLFVSGDFDSLTQNRWIQLTLNGAAGIWRTTSVNNRNLFSAALSLALRFYPFNTQTIHPYLLASGGPAYISSRQFNLNRQGANVTFQTIAGLGFEFGKAQRFDLNVKLVHFSSADIFYPNEGYNFLYVVSLGYLFNKNPELYISKK